MEVEDLLIETLATFGYPVRLQGSLLENEPYPSDFFTFWNDSSNSQAFYDNNENAIIYEYSVNFYSVDSAKVYSVLREAKSKLKQVGFIVGGDGHSVASDETSHDGRGIDITYMKYPQSTQNERIDFYGWNNNLV
jgi:hypothetical protein